MEYFKNKIKNLYLKIKEYYYDTPDLRKIFVVLFYYILIGFWLKYLFYGKLFNLLTHSLKVFKVSQIIDDSGTKFVYHGKFVNVTAEEYVYYANLFETNMNSMWLVILIAGILIRVITRFITNLWVFLLTKMRYGYGARGNSEAEIIQINESNHKNMYKKLINLILFTPCAPDFGVFKLFQGFKWAQLYSYNTYLTFFKEYIICYIILACVYGAAVKIYESKNIRGK